MQPSSCLGVCALLRSAWARLSFPGKGLSDLCKGFHSVTNMLYDHRSLDMLDRGVTWDRSAGDKSVVA